MDSTNGKVFGVDTKAMPTISAPATGGGEETAGARHAGEVVTFKGLGAATTEGQIKKDDSSGMQYKVINGKWHEWLEAK